MGPKTKKIPAACKGTQKAKKQDKDSYLADDKNFEVSHFMHYTCNYYYYNYSILIIISIISKLFRLTRRNVKFTRFYWVKLA